MKKCSKCKEIKELENFGKNKSHKDGLQNNCKLCSKSFDYGYQNQNKTQFKNYQRLYRRTRRRTDVIFRLSHNLRRRLRHALKLQSKRGSAIKELGCTGEELKIHLEKQFKPGMTWDNYGIKKGQWSIDHIIPLTKVDLNNEEDFKKVNHYTNLQPMWHSDNVKKFNKI